MPMQLPDPALLDRVTQPDPERLSPDDAVYHGRVLAQQDAARAVAESWIGHLTAKYGLAEMDRIGRDGVIVRAGAED